MSAGTVPIVVQAVEALRRFDRHRAVSLLEREFVAGPPEGERWRSVGMLAARIGEIGMAIEAARRFAATRPISPARQLHYFGELAAFGRIDQALAEIGRLPDATRQDPNILHFLGTVIGQLGDFEAAERQYRAALAKAPHQAQTWFALAMIKTFAVDDDPDLAAMDRLDGAWGTADPQLRARLFYARAKARADIGEHEKAFALYAEGAAIRRAASKYDRSARERFCDRLIDEFTPAAMEMLTPSREPSERAIFVNGLPRSGTTLVEQILASHSQISDGAEINLVRAALIPTGDYTFAGARAYEARAADDTDPWGRLARDYLRMLDMRFGAEGRIVDKTLGQSHLMGLLLHVLPNARIIWIRRDPEDTALSCFRSFFTADVPWSWSLEGIGHFFRLEDRLYRHWTALFPDRILTVPYEELARTPHDWIPKVLAHVGLPTEPQVFEPHKTARTVRTASVQQVRAPISTDRIGLSGAYATPLEAFRRAYHA